MASVLLEAVRDEEKRYKTAESVLMAFLIGLTALNIIGVLTYLGVVGDKKFVLPLAPLHLHWIWFSNINALGLYTAASFLLYPRSAPSRGRTLFLYAFTALAVLGILLSTSRTAWLGILVTSLIMIFIVSRSRRVFFITAAGVAVVCIALYLFIPIIRSRILEIGSDIAKFTAGEAATSLGERFVMWKAAFTMFLSHPIMGVGSGDYVPTVSAYVSSGKFPPFLLDYNQPHNIYLFALATNGLIGLAALLYIFYRILKITVPIMLPAGGEKGRLFAFLAVATAIHFLIAGLTDSFFNIQILRYAFAFIMGVCVRQSVISARSS
jgi:O-antigen ligase